MSTQPTEKPPMSTNPNAQTMNEGQQPVHDQTRDWSTGLCACDAEGFVLSCFCPCITYGKNKQRYQGLQNGTPLKPDQIEGCGNDTLLFCGVQCLVGAGWLFDFMLRSDVRERYRITGSAAQDFFTSCCCLPCSLEQQSRELAIEETSVQVNQQPKAQNPMPTPAY